jgi:ribonuclease HI
LLEGVPGGDTVAEIAEYLGRTTNNVAEYRALILGLQRALDLGATAVEVVSDSELMVRQVEGRYQVRNAALASLAREVGDLRRRFPDGFRIRHVLRGGNRRADELANAAIDRAQGREPSPAPSPAPSRATEAPDIHAVGARLRAGGTADLGAGLRLVRPGTSWRQAQWVLVLEGAVEVGEERLQTGQYRAGPLRYRGGGKPALVVEMGGEL